MARRFRTTCIECDKPIHRKRFMRCKEHHEKKWAEEAAKLQARRVLESGSIPVAYRKWKDPKAWKWKAGVIYGKGRL